MYVLRILLTLSRVIISPVSTYIKYIDAVIPMMVIGNRARSRTCLSSLSYVYVTVFPFVIVSNMHSTYPQERYNIPPGWGTFPSMVH